MLRRHPVVLKETRNRADTKVSVTVEPEFILSQRLTRTIGECQANLYSFSNKCESNLKPDSHSRYPSMPEPTGGPWSPAPQAY